MSEHVFIFWGYAGITYEHSPAEGPAVAALMDYVMDKMLVAWKQDTLKNKCSTRCLKFPA